MALNPNLSRKTLIMAATEPVSNTNSITTQLLTGVSSSAFLAFDEINPLSVDFNVVDTTPVRASLTPQKNLVGRKLVNVRPKTLWMNSPGIDFINLTDNSAAQFDDFPGTATHTNSGSPSYALKTSTGLATVDGATSGRAPYFGSLLRACGLKQLNYLSNSVIYEPRSSSFETASVWVYADQILHKAAGCVGTFTLAGTAGEGIELQFDLQGSYNSPTGANTQPTTTYPADKKTLMNYAKAIVTANNDGTDSTENGVGYQGGGSSERPIIRSFNFDAGVTVTERGDISSNEGLYGLYITDRAPTLDLTVEVENNLVSASGKPGFNPILDMANANTHNISFQHGPSDSSGNKTAHSNTVFSFPQAQLVDVQYGDDAGIRTYNLSYSLTNTVDDDEYSITIGNPADLGAQPVT